MGQSNRSRYQLSRGLNLPFQRPSDYFQLVKDFAEDWELVSLQWLVENFLAGEWVKDAMMIIVVSPMDVVITQHRMPTCNPCGIPKGHSSYPAMSSRIANFHHLLDFQHDTAKAINLPTLRDYLLFLRVVEHDSVWGIMVNKRMFR